jgi:hypothetical protein
MRPISVALACGAILACSGAAAEDGDWTVYPPMGSDSQSERPDHTVIVWPGEAPGSEILELDGQVVLIATLPPGYCPLSGEPSVRAELLTQYGLRSRAEGPALGLAVDCASRVGPDGTSEVQRLAAYLSFHPLVSAGGPVWLGVSRPDFLSMFRDAGDSVPQFEIPAGGEEDAIPAMGRWLTEGPGRPDEPGGAFLAMPLGRDENAAYTAILRTEMSGGRRLVRAVIDGHTIVNGVLAVIRAFSEIETAADVRSLHEAARLYARHLIAVNEGAP